MDDFIPYVPKEEFGAHKQVEAFVAYCRNELTVFGTDLDWAGIRWDITDTVPVAGQNRRHLIKWVKFKQPTEPLSPPFGDFARAYLRHLRGKATLAVFHQQLIVLRVLEKALLERSPDGIARVERVDHYTLDRTLEVILNHYDPSMHYSYARHLATLNTLLERMRLVARRSDWKNPIPAPIQKHRLDNDDKIKEERNRKLPTEKAFRALLEIFAKEDLSPRDQVVTALAMILCAAPQRASETSDLWEQCDVWREFPNGRRELCLRWYPVKGGTPQVKPVPEGWAPVVEEALARLRTLSAEGRRMALWYEQHPMEIYLPPHLEYLRKREWLTTQEVLKVLGINEVTFSHHNKYNDLKWAREKDPNCKKGRGYRYRFICVENHVLGYLPRGFPVANPNTGMKFSECMLVFPQRLYRRCVTNVSPVMFHKFDSKMLQDALGRANQSKRNIFEHHGYFDGGKPLCVTTKMFRHLLTTMAQQANMSVLGRTVWRGSSRPEQSLVYSHRTSEEQIIDMGLIPGESLTGRKNEPVEIVPYTLEEARNDLILNKLLGHPTEFGWCTQDYAQEPCKFHRDCLNCTEQICVVGDEERCQRIAEIKELAEQALANAQEGQDEGFHGADHWVRHKQRTVTHASQLLSILRDPSLEPGTVVRLNNKNQYNPFIEAAEERVKLTGDPNDRIVAELVGRPKMIGGDLNGAELDSGTLD